MLDRHYVIERALAVGGAGLTYLAREVGPAGEPAGPKLAIKVLYQQRDKGDFLRRLANEAQILQELAHSHIVECRGFVHRRCVGLKADATVSEDWLCPLCDDGAASKLSVHGGPLAKSSPLIGRVLLVPPGAEVLAAASDGSDDDAGRAPLLLRAVGARTRPEAVTADATKPPPSGSRVAVTFDCGEEYEGTVDDVLDDKSAMIDFDDGQSDKFDFPDPDLRVISGSDVVVRCVALFGDGEESWEISEAAARDAALRRETAELHAISDRWARGAKHVFHTTTPNCEVCAHCLDAPRNGGPATLKKACIEKDGETACPPQHAPASYVLTQIVPSSGL